MKNAAISLNLGPGPSGPRRLASVDMLRGFVIVFMVLDHVRDFFLAGAVLNPTDPATSYPLLFATRWITHLCAPTFVFLAGVSIFLQGANGKGAGDLTRFLLARGFWLILLESTIVTFGFNFGEPFLFLQVIWAIGAGMVCMAAIARLSPPVVLAIGIAIIALCPAAISATAGATGAAAIVRTLTLSAGVVHGLPILAVYPVVPWLGVMSLGFGLGPVFVLAPALRSRVAFMIGFSALAAFVLMRVVNGYGDPAPWSAQPTEARAVMSFLNVSKYPPSPEYVLATLGVSLLLFVLLERFRGPVARVLVDFGRTPLFTYLLHIYIAHGLMLVVAATMGMPGAALNYFGTILSGGTRPAAWGFSLATVYGIWIAIILVLVPLSRWFAGVKRRRRDWWISYL